MLVCERQLILVERHTTWPSKIACNAQVLQPPTRQIIMKVHVCAHCGLHGWWQKCRQCPLVFCCSRPAKLLPGMFTASLAAVRDETELPPCLSPRWSDLSSSTVQLLALHLQQMMLLAISRPSSVIRDLHIAAPDDVIVKLMLMTCISNMLTSAQWGGLWP